MDGQTYCEEEVFINTQSTHSTPEGIPYRDLSNLALYTDEGEIVNMTEIAKAGPFVATGTAPCVAYVKKEHWESPVRITPILEYSFEYPYGGPALVWLRSEAAFYKITSAAPTYMMYWEPIVEAANVAGHAVNILLASRAGQTLSKVITKMSKLSHWTTPKVLGLVTKHREFILQQIKSQKHIKLRRSSFANALYSSASWELACQKVLSEARIQPPAPATTSSTILSSPTRPSPNAVDDLLLDQEPSPLPVVRPANRNFADALRLAPLILLENAEPISPSPIKVAERECKRRGKRTFYDANGVDLALVRLRLPSVSDTMFVCPFCGVYVFRGEEPSVAAKLADHIKAIHLNREHPPQLWCNGAFYDEGSGNREACDGAFSGGAACATTPWTSNQLISTLIPQDKMLGSLRRHSLSLTKLEKWDRSRAALAPQTIPDSLETVAGGHLGILHHKPTANFASLRLTKLLPKPSSRLLSMTTLCNEERDNSVKECMKGVDFITASDKQPKVIIESYPVDGKISPPMCCSDPKDSFHINSSNSELTALSSSTDSNQLHSPKRRVGSTLAFSPSEQRTPRVGQIQTSAPEKPPLQFNPDPKHLVLGATRSPKKPKHCPPLEGQHESASWPHQERQAIPKGAFSPIVHISGPMHLERSESPNMCANDVPMNPIPVSLKALSLFKSFPVETPSSVPPPNTPIAGNEVQAQNGKVLETIEIGNSAVITEIGDHKESSPTSRNVTTLGLGKIKRVRSINGLDASNAISSGLHIRSKDYPANLGFKAASQTSARIPGETASCVNGLLSQVEPMKGDIHAQSDVAPILRDKSGPPYEEGSICNFERLARAIEDATARASKLDAVSEVASGAPASTRLRQLPPANTLLIQGNRTADQNLSPALLDKLSKAVGAIDYPSPSAGGMMIEDRTQVTATLANDPSHKYVQTDTNLKKSNYSTCPEHLGDSEPLHADESLAIKVCKEDAPSSLPLEIAKECCWRCGAFISDGARICSRCSAVQG